MDQHDGCARPQTRPLRGTCITRTVDIANPRLIGVWKWNFEEANRRLYAVCIFAPNVLRDDYPLEDLQLLKDCIAEQVRKVEKMIDWTRAQLHAAGLQAGEPGRIEPLSADIRTPLASAYADLFPRADLAIQLLDALWLQGELTDAGHEDRGDAPRAAQCPGRDPAGPCAVPGSHRGAVSTAGVEPGVGRCWLGSGAWEGL